MSNVGILLGPPFLALVDRDGTNPQRESCVYVVQNYLVPQGYAAYLLGDDIPDAYAQNLAAYCPNASILYHVQNVAQFNNYDIVDVSENGDIRTVYQDASSDNVLFITNQCNSNCIMCPDSNTARKSDMGSRIEYLQRLIELIPSDTAHLTITGGEPTLLKWDLLDMLEKCKEKFTNTEFLMLSNGRTLANRAYRETFLESVPNRFRLAVPLYGCTPAAHDLITRAPGSFEQTITALKVLQHQIAIEVRIVVMQDTYRVLPDIANYIVTNLSHIRTVSIMGMELLGNAAVSREKLWVDFHDTVSYVEDAVRILLSGGVDVRIYNYPLCSLPRSLWSIAARSISEYKVRYQEACEQCAVKNLCGGFFFSTLHFANIRVDPIREG
jgi:His-Xaa-Ser system radical SAM maturase HxsC